MGHMVDALFFMTTIDGLRKLESKKNRFGQAQVAWIFQMTENGLLDLGSAEGEIEEKSLRLDYKKIREIIDKSPINKFILESDMKWLFKRAFRGTPQGFKKFNIYYSLKAKN